jgi:hypothetical protein
MMAGMAEVEDMTGTGDMTVVEVMKSDIRKKVVNRYGEGYTKLTLIPVKEAKK